jgi:glucan biosynthesis protein C
MMWTLVALTLGVFRKFLAQPRPVIRYLADSSYWMYLVHLPVVVWLQVAVAEVPVHWTAKLAFISIATIACSLLTYDLAVRSTWLGQLLNGRRRERALRLNRAAR